jgi:ATP-binding cassette subfamily B protein/ATP-binding cassette subfamily C protein
MLATGVARILVIFVGRVTKTQHRFTISSLVRRNLLAGILQRPGALALDNRDCQSLSAGAVISFFREDVTQLEDNVAWTNELAGEILFAVFALAILLVIDTQITLGVLLPLVLMVGVLERTQVALKRFRRASRQATQRVTGLLGEIFGAVQTIKVAGAEQHVLHHFQQLNDQRRQAALQDQLFTTLLHSVFENLTSLGTGGILLVIATASRSSSLSVGDLALFVYYLAYVSGFVHNLGQFLALSKQSEISVARMEELLPDTAHPLSLVAAQPLYLPDLRGRQPPLPPLTPLPQRIPLQEMRVSELSYRYRHSSQGIHTISFTLRRGSLTVITGEVGSGKTTLLRTLLGLLPKQAGSIWWNTQIIEDPATFFVPPQAAYLPQVPHLFSQSLLDNLTLGLTLNQSDLEWGIEQAMFQSDLAQMPLGLATPIGSKGVRLSGGQMQRVAAARMLVRQPELMVFDDLSSALDLKTEQQLWSRLLALKDQQQEWIPTFLVISHRHFVLEQADQILQMEDGCLVS